MQEPAAGEPAMAWAPLFIVCWSPALLGCATIGDNDSGDVEGG
jgi:hypothetical protein